jgi:hypothetical protein
MLTLYEANQYGLNQWSKLSNTLWKFDNKRADRAVKPFVLVCKNTLLNQNHRRAEACAVLSSMIETAKANSSIPFDCINPA